MKILTKDEATKFYAFMKNSIVPEDTFLQLLFETGARITETLSLSADSLVGAELTIEPLKNSNRRVVTISSSLVLKLNRLHDDRWSRSLFAETASLPSLRKSLSRHMASRSKNLLGRTLNLHILRHTAFSRLYAATKDLLLVKQWAGHRSINSTMKYMQLDQMEEANQASISLLKSFGT